MAGFEQNAKLIKVYYNNRDTENFEEVHGHLRRGDIVGVTGYPGEHSDMN